MYQVIEKDWKLFRKLLPDWQEAYMERLAKEYIEEHNLGKLLSLAGQLPEYLHGVDKAAEELYDVMWDKLSKSEEYRHTGNYLEDVKRINAMKQVIEEEILSEIVYI